MILEILKFVQVVFGAAGIGAGAWVLFGFLEGKLFQKWAIVFSSVPLSQAPLASCFRFTTFFSHIGLP